jgi:hypothetical protein
MKDINQFTDSKHRGREFVLATRTQSLLKQIELPVPQTSSGYHLFLSPSGIDAASINWSAEIQLGGNANTRLFEFLDDLKCMKSLPDNWNGYGSERPNSRTRDIAEWILLATPGFRLPDRVAPSAQGGIGISFHDRDKYADIECFNTGEILGTIVTGNGEPEIWPINFNEIRIALKKIGDYLAP